MEIASACGRSDIVDRGGRRRSGRASGYAVFRWRTLDGRTARHAGYGVSQRIRKRIEEGFGRGKRCGSPNRIRMRGRERVDTVFAFPAAACDLIRRPGRLAEPKVA